MKNQNIYIALITLTLGLALGYLLFSPNKDTAQINSHKTEHNHAAEDIWTCSMHPQIQSSEPGLCPICAMDLVPLDQNASLNSDQIILDEQAKALAQIQTMEVSQGQVNRQITLYGTVESELNNRFNQVIYFDGRIENIIDLSEGKSIRKGQWIADVYAPKLSSVHQALILAAQNKENDPATYQALVNKLRAWKLNDITIKNLESEEKARSTFSIYAQNTGFINANFVKQGDELKAGQTIFEIRNLDKLWVVLDVYERQLSQIHKGDKVWIEFDELAGRQIIGTVDIINPFVNQNTKTSQIKISIENKDGSIKPGMIAKGIVQGNSFTGKEILIPSSAVLWTGKRSIVYKKSDADTYEMIQVELGPKNQGQYQIISGLDIGDEIVIKGAFVLDASAQLQGKTSMMSESASEEKAEKLNSTPEFRQSLEELFKNYLEIKNAMVAADSNKVTKEAKSMKNMLVQDYQNTEKNIFGKTGLELYKESNSTMIKSLEDILSTDDLALQRMQLENLTLHMSELIRSFGISSPVYLEFCPMVDGNKGGYWLSDESLIRNPYFGDQMLECGSVVEIL